MVENDYILWYSVLGNTINSNEVKIWEIDKR